MPFRFRNFPVYRAAREFRREIIKIVETFPKKEFYLLTAQIKRAINSIVLNVAEGSDRGTDLDFAHFLNTALTSVNEVVACLDCALDDGYINQKIHQEYVKKAERLANQLTAFRKSLLFSPTK